MIQRLQVFAEKFAEAFTACGLCMVQGDLSVFTLEHAYIAGKVGALTGIAFILAMSIPFNHKLLPIYLTGILVAIADFIVHPSAMGHALVEPIVTGAVAMIIALIYERGKNYVRV